VNRAPDTDYFKPVNIFVYFAGRLGIEISISTIIKLNFCCKMRGKIVPKDKISDPNPVRQHGSTIAILKPDSTWIVLFVLYRQKLPVTTNSFLCRFYLAVQRGMAVGPDKVSN
jgi:hypothetical protein